MKEVCLGTIGSGPIVHHILDNVQKVEGVSLKAVYSRTIERAKQLGDEYGCTNVYTSLEKMLADETVNTVYVASPNLLHYEQAKQALLAGKHVLCESPIALQKEQCIELFQIAKEKGLVLQESIKTAYSLAYSRLVLLAKGGKIGKIVSVDTSCTSLKDLPEGWGSLDDWVLSQFNEETGFDSFTKVNFRYDHSVASVKVANGVKSEGELIVSGTKGYIYVPAPWWKTDYFEVRFENPDNNKRYFYQLDGEGMDDGAFPRQP